MRLLSGVMQRFMFWDGCRKSECTYETTDNTLECAEVLTQVLRLEYTDRRPAVYAAVKKHLGGFTFTMEYEGKAGKMLSAKDKFFDMDLSDWCKQSANVDINGWAISTYTEWAQEY
jgi:hypothetical protein